MKRAGKGLAAWVRSGMPSQRNRPKAPRWYVSSGPGFGSEGPFIKKSTARKAAQRLADRYDYAVQYHQMDSSGQSVGYPSNVRPRAETRQLKRMESKSQHNRPKKSFNAKRRKAPTLTLAQGRKLYELGRRAPKTPVSIKTNGKGCSIVTGKAARKLQGR
jgi:hypothetical protein